MSAPTRGAAPEYSRGSGTRPGPEDAFARVRWLLLAAGLIGGALLVVADFTKLLDVKVITVVRDSVTGGENHNYALVVIGVATVPMAWGAAVGRSRPAMLALTALGALALFIALVIDLPDVRRSDFLRDFSDARSEAKTGFYLETLGAILVLVSGGLQLIMSAPASGGSKGRRRQTVPTPASARSLPSEDEAG